MDFLIFWVLYNVHFDFPSTLEPIMLFIDHLDGAITSSYNRYNGFTLAELMLGLSKIAQNDENKRQVCTYQSFQ